MLLMQLLQAFSVLPRFPEFLAAAKRLFARWHKFDQSGGVLVTGSEFEECFRVLNVDADVKDVR